MESYGPLNFEKTYGHTMKTGRHKIGLDSLKRLLKEDAAAELTPSKKKMLDELANGLANTFLSRLREMTPDKAEEFISSYEALGSDDPENKYLTVEVARKCREGLEKSPPPSPPLGPLASARAAEEKPIEIIDTPDPEKPTTWDDLLEEIFSWYQIDTRAFIPVDVKSGRKFKGFCYILSFKANYGSYMGRSFETMVYRAWDPEEKCLVQFNTNMVNLLGLTDFNIGDYADKWDMTVKVDDAKMFQDFKEYFTSLVRRAVERCGRDYRYMKNYLSACTRFEYGSHIRSGLPEEITDQIIDFVKNGDVA